MFWKLLYKFNKRSWRCHVFLPSYYEEWAEYVKKDAFNIIYYKDVTNISSHFLFLRTWSDYRSYDLYMNSVLILYMDVKTNILWSDSGLQWYKQEDYFFFVVVVIELFRNLWLYVVVVEVCFSANPVISLINRFSTEYYFC